MKTLEKVVSSHAAHQDSQQYITDEEHEEQHRTAPTDQEEIQPSSTSQQSYQHSIPDSMPDVFPLLILGALRTKQ